MNLLETRGQENNYCSFNKDFLDPASTLPDLFNTAFILKGYYCPSIHFVFECILKNEWLEIEVISEKIALRNMKLHQSSVDDDPRGFQRVILSSDPYNTTKGTSIVFLPYLEAETRSIIDVIKNFASLPGEGYLIINGGPVTGKSTICKTIVPMIMSTEPSTRNSLFLYQHLSFDYGYDISLQDFCSNWMIAIQSDFVRQLGTLKIGTNEREEGNSLNSQFGSGLNRILTLIKTVSDNFGLVWVLDDILDVLVHYQAKHLEEIRTFLTDLVQFTAKKTLKLILTSNNIIFDFFKMIDSETLNMPTGCLAINLPSEHNSELLKAADQILEEYDCQLIALSPSEQSSEIKTANFRFDLSHSRNFVVLKSRLILYYDKILRRYLIEVSRDTQKVYKELTSIALQYHKILNNQADASNLFEVKNAEHSSPSVHFKCPYFVEFLRELENQYRVGGAYEGCLSSQFIAIKGLYAYSKAGQERTILLSDLLGSLCRVNQFDARAAALRLLNCPYNTQTRRRALCKLGIYCASDAGCPQITMNQMLDVFSGFTPEHLCLRFNRNCILWKADFENSFKISRDNMIPCIEGLPELIDDSLLKKYLHLFGWNLKASY